MSNAKQDYTLEASLRRHRSPSRRRSGRRSTTAWLARAAGALALLAAAASCTPEIGDKCQVSTDCSVRGDRLCDTSQPGGYCTQLNCGGNGCADEASCVLFGSAVPGCAFDDRAGPTGSRVARSFCMAKCEANDDCRPGYVCADPTTFPWNAKILDTDQSKRSCLPVPLEDPDASVVTPMAPSPSAVNVCAATSGDAGGSIEASAPAVGVDPAVPPLFPDAAAPADGGGG